MTKFAYALGDKIIYSCLCPNKPYCSGCAVYEKHKKYAYPNPLTRADQIRAMSDEELAEFMNHGACPPGRDVLELCYDEDGGSVPDKCNLCWLNWLKQEAK